MRLTKLEHSAMFLERSGTKLVIDPGKFTTPVTESAGAVAIVVTHQHDDHWTPAQLGRVWAANPGIPLFAPADAAALIGAADIAGAGEIRAVGPGDDAIAGDFRLSFWGGAHAEIHSSIPLVDNVGVLVNDRFYYGGDSYDAPEGVQVDVLAVPAYAPWMRIAESIDYILRVKPSRVLAVHEMLLSRAGKELAETRLRQAVESVGGSFIDLQPFDSIDLD